MAILHSSPFSMQLSYHVFVIDDDWMLYYHAVPLFCGRPFIPAEYVRQFRQPPGVFDFTDCDRGCTLTGWMKKVLNGETQNNEWQNVNPLWVTIYLFPGNKAPFEAQALFIEHDAHNWEGNGKPGPDEWLLQWVFPCSFFALSEDEPDYLNDLIIHQWITRSQLEHWIAELESELETALDDAGVPWQLYK